MARPRKTTPVETPREPLRQRILRWGRRGIAAIALCLFALIVLFAVVDPPTDIYMMQERARLGTLDHDWADWDEIAPVVARSVVAAEDANFCRHWGFDMGAIRAAIDAGGRRGASTISQQVAKNVFLWQGRSYIRKALEAAITPVMETVWTKRRILEVYLNMAEFGQGTFGIRAAAERYFKTSPTDLSPQQAARLAAVLPDPKGRDAGRPSAFVRQRARAILDGAATIRADGRAACFE